MLKIMSTLLAFTCSKMLQTAHASHNQLGHDDNTPQEAVSCLSFDGEILIVHTYYGVCNSCLCDDSGLAGPYFQDQLAKCLII